MNKVDDRVLIVEKNEGKKRIVPSSSSSTSSIGKNSDVSGKSMEDSGDTEEVQSTFKGPLEAMEALEDVLPMRRGISRFYNGKSKSYGSLSDATSISIKDIGKPENAYMKRRRSLIACGTSIAWDHSNRNYSPNLKRINNGGRGISKRILTNTNARAAALAFALTNNNDQELIRGSTLIHDNNARLDPLYEDTPSYGSSSSSFSFSSPPFTKFSQWRSFSMADLQQLPATIPVSLNSLEHISDRVTAPTK